MSKTGLQNAYLTLLVSKGARTHAKFLQGCRSVGVQIRASREPIAVVCKFMMCGSCFESSKEQRIVNVTDLLKIALANFPTNAKYNQTDFDGKLGTKQVKGHNSFNAKVQAKNGPNPGAQKKQSVKRYPNNRLKRKSLAIKAEAKKLRFDHGDLDKDSLNVVIVSTDDDMYPASSRNHLLSRDKSVTATLRPRTLSKPINNPMKVINTTAKFPIRPASVLAGGKTYSFKSQPPLSSMRHYLPVIMPTFKPCNSGATGDMRMSTNCDTKKPFLVKIVENGAKLEKIRKQSTEGAPSTMLKAVPINTNCIKFLKTVPVQKKFHSIKLPAAVWRNGAKVPNSTRTGETENKVSGIKGLATMQPVTVIRSNLLPVKDELSRPVRILFAGNCVRKQPISFVAGSSEGKSDANAHVPQLKKANPLQVRSHNKTPSKKRPKISFPSKPMSTVVAEYLLSLKPSADQSLWRKLGSRRKKRWEKSSLMIPVPYETHYLCIDSTIQKHGWKAYWYRKCRCSKIREYRCSKAEEKAAITDNEESELVSGHSPKDVKKWIPNSLTDNMRDELVNSFIREDNYLSSSNMSKEISSPNTTSRKISFVEENEVDQELLAVKQDDVSDSVISRPDSLNFPNFKLEFQEGSSPLYNQASVPTGAPSRLNQAHLSLYSPKVGEAEKIYRHTNVPNQCNEEENQFKVSMLSSALGTSPLTLKARYCRGENGMWKAVERNNPSTLAQSSSSKTNQPISANHVQLDLFSSVMHTPNALHFPIVKATEANNSGRLRKCPRATMQRRKSLIERAIRFERNTVAKRQSTESCAMQNFMFASAPDTAAAEHGFSVVATHPVVFKENQYFQTLLESNVTRKSEFKQGVCTPRPTDSKDHLRKKRHYECIFSHIMQNGDFSKKGSKGMAEIVAHGAKRRKCGLVTELEGAWNAERAKPEIGQCDTKSLASKALGRKCSSTRKIIRKQLCIGQLDPELVHENLQLLRGVTADYPHSSVISARSAEFVVSALRLPTSDNSKPKTRCCKPKEYGKNMCPISDLKITHTDISRIESIPSTISNADSVVSEERFGAHADRMSTPEKSDSKRTISSKSSQPRYSTNRFNVLVRNIFLKLYRASICSSNRILKVSDYSSDFRFGIGELRRSLTSSATLSGLLGSTSIIKQYQEYHCDGKMEEDVTLFYNFGKKSTGEVQGSKLLSWPGNKRKRKKTFVKGALGLDSCCGKLLSCNVAHNSNTLSQSDFNPTKPLTSLLSRNIDLRILKRGLWETTSAMPISLQDENGMKRTLRHVFSKKRPVKSIKVSKKKESEKALPHISASQGKLLKNSAPVLQGSETDICRSQLHLSDKDIASSSEDCAKMPQRPEVQSRFTRPNLMLIKHNSSPDQHPFFKRPQGITKARMNSRRRLHECYEEDLTEKTDERSNHPSAQYKSSSECPAPIQKTKQCEDTKSPKLTFRHGRLAESEKEVQMLREKVFAELQRLRKSRFDQEDANGTVSDYGCGDRKLNRCSTNGSFISRLIQFDSN